MRQQPESSVVLHLFENKAWIETQWTGQKPFGAVEKSNMITTIQQYKLYSLNTNVWNATVLKSNTNLLWIGTREKIKTKSFCYINDPNGCGQPKNRGFYHFLPPKNNP